MHNTTQRITRLTQELTAVQQELQNLMLDWGCGERMDLVGEGVDFDAVRELKSAVDQARHFLWFFIQAMTNNSEESERTLQVLRQVAKSNSAVRGRSPLSFLEKLNALAECALVHSRDEGIN
jgi:hypothetical protein